MIKYRLKNDLGEFWTLSNKFRYITDPNDWLSVLETESKEHIDEEIIFAKQCYPKSKIILEIISVTIEEVYV